MFKLFENKTIAYVFLAILILAISFPEIASTAKAATTDNDWTAQPLFHARPAAAQGPDPLTPSQIVNAYSLTSTSNGAGTTIAIVDAYDAPNIASDLAAFSANFALPPANFVKHKMANVISSNGGWALEISLDVEWAHAIAPQATILLVEARSSSLSDLLAAVKYATSYPGVVAVSMSWGGNEFSSQSSYDSYFAKSGIVFFAASGDNGAGVIWPSSSPNVVSVGGTTLNLDQSGAVISETAWSGSGGGISAYSQIPAYQTNYGLTYAKRSTPDVSYDADPNTGFYVYDTTPYQGSTGWWDVGGTSAGAPQWAAIQALSQTTGNNNFYPDASQSAASYFRDITVGSNGNPAAVGYDLVTGLGSPITTNFKAQSTPDYSISASPNPITINAGTAGTTTIIATFLNGFNNPVTLSTPTLPSSWTTNFDTNQLSASGATATLTVNVPTTAAKGTYTLTVTGVSGSISHSQTITVQVTTPDFSISASPTSLTIRSGSSKTSTITVNPINGFAGTVSLTSTAPNGLSASLNPTSITTSGTSTLKITVPSNVRSGTYTVTVTAKSGSLTHSASVRVTVSRSG